MNEGGNDDPKLDPPATKSDIISIFERHHCPAEIILPYRLPDRPANFASAFWRSRFKGPLWNMDSPWLKAMAFNGIVTATAALIIAALAYFFNNGDPGDAFVFVVGAYPLIFFALGPLVYIYLILSNLMKGYKADGPAALLAPTHIGLTDSGFKLYWRGGYFYNYPSLAIWPEVYKIDLVFDQLYQAPSLKFVYQTGFGRSTIWLPMSGFTTASDMQMVLTYFAKYVPDDHQGHNLKLMFEKNFEPLVKAFDSQSLADLSPLLPDKPTPPEITTDTVIEPAALVNLFENMLEQVSAITPTAQIEDAPQESELLEFSPACDLQVEADDDIIDISSIRKDKLES